MADITQQPLYTPDGKPIGIDDSSAATAAALAGKLLPKKGTKVGVIDPATGKVGEVDSEKLQSVLQQGATLATDDEYKKAQAEAKWGENTTAGKFAGTAAALGLGGVRGLSYGSSDAVITEGAKVLLPPEQAKRVREYVRDSKEVLHTVANPIGEVGGMLVGAALTGGEAGLASAAEGRGASLGARALARFNPAGLADAFGGAVESRAAAGAERLLGKGLGARIAGRTVSGAARGLGEAVPYSLGRSVSEAELGDENLTAEKTLANLRHDALLFGGIGGAVGAGVGAFEAAASKMAPHLRRASDTQALRMLDPQAGQLKRISKGAKGTEKVDDLASWFNREVKPQANETAEQVLERLPGLGEKYEKGFEDFAQKMGGKPVVDSNKLADDLYEKVIKPMEGTPGLEGPVNQAKAYTRSLRNKVVDHDGFIAELRSGILDPMERVAPLTDNPAWHSTMRNVTDYLDTLAGRPLDAGVVQGELKALLQPLGKLGKVEKAAGRELSGFVNDMSKRSYGGPISYEQAREWRIGLDGMLDPAWRSLNPTMAAQQKIKIRGIFEDQIEDGIDKLARKVEGLAAKGEAGSPEMSKALQEYKDIKYNWGWYKEVRNMATNTALKREFALRNLSITDYMAGLSGANLGHLMMGSTGALPGLALGLANKWGRTRGNATAAWALNKLADFGTLKSFVDGTDLAISKGTEGFVKSGATKFKPRTFNHGDNATSPDQPLSTRYSKVVSVLNNYNSNPDKLQENLALHTRGMEEVAPKTQLAMQATVGKGLAFLNSKLPTGQPDNILQPGLAKPSVSDADKARFMQYVEGTWDPLSVLDDMQKGHVTQEKVEALKAVHPNLFKDMQVKILAEIGRMTADEEELPYQKRLQLGILFDLPTDPSMQPQNLQALQANLNPQAQQGGPGGAPGGGGRPAGSKKAGDKLNSMFGTRLDRLANSKH